MKPSSFKRPRLPSGNPPKPAPRPDRKKELKEEKKEEEKPEVRKEAKPEVKKEEKPKVEEAKPEVMEEPEEKKDVKPFEKKEEEPDGKKEEEPKKEEKKEVVEDKEKPVEDVKKEEDEKKKEETQTNEKEEKPSKELEEPKEEVEKKLEDAGADTAEVESTGKKDGKVPNGEMQLEEKDDSEKVAAKDDLWVKRESGKEALRPGGRSMSLKVQRSTSATEKVAPSLRSATLPKPWSPGQAPSSMLSRKLSWEMPKAGDEGVKKERKESSGEEPIPEVSEDQNSKT